MALAVTQDIEAVASSNGSQTTLSGSQEVGRGFRGVYVDDVRYGRVLISWDTFDRAEFSAADAAPAELVRQAVAV